MVTVKPSGLLRIKFFKLITSISDDLFIDCLVASALDCAALTLLPILPELMPLNIASHL